MTETSSAISTPNPKIDKLISNLRRGKDIKETLMELLRMDAAGLETFDEAELKKALRKYHNHRTHGKIVEQLRDKLQKGAKDSSSPIVEDPAINVAALVRLLTKNLVSKIQIRRSFAALLDLNGCSLAIFRSSRTELVLKKYLNNRMFKKMATQLQMKIQALKTSEEDGKKDCNQVETPWRQDLPDTFRARFPNVRSLADRLAIFQ